jgi:uncharacterized protein YkwD
MAFKVEYAILSSYDSIHSFICYNKGQEGIEMTSWKGIKIQQSLKVLLALVILLGGILLPANSSWALSYSYLTFPQGKSGIARPDIGVNLELSESISPASYELYLNNKLVEPISNRNNSSFTYQPKTDLAPGNYNAKLVITFSGYQTKSIDWSFSILEGAGTLSTSSSQEQRIGLQAINDYRILLGLPPVVFNNTLNTAAQKHANYLAVNRIDPVNTSVSLHDEHSSKAAYIGSTLVERMNYVGYGKGAAEDVAYKNSSLVEAIDSLFEAPYHRGPFLNPDMIEVGVAREGNYHVIQFGFKEPSGTQLTISPSDGDVFVPTSFDGNEIPDPIRMHKQTSYPVGYPLMATVTGPNITKVSIQAASLKDESGKNVELLQNQAANDDHLDNEVILLPAKPLSADTIYQASVKLQGVYGDGRIQTFERAWKFRTEPTPGIGATKLHSDAKGYMLQVSNLGLKRKHSVSFGLDNQYYLVDQVQFPMMRKPHIVDGTSFLYIRDLAAALGATVTWDDSRKAAIYTKKDKTVTFFTKRNVYAINGIEYTTVSPALLVNETTMIPVRLLSNSLEAKVDYVDRTRTVVLTY